MLLKGDNTIDFTFRREMIFDGEYRNIDKWFYRSMRTGECGAIDDRKLVEKLDYYTNKKEVDNFLSTLKKHYEPIFSEVEPETTKIVDYQTSLPNIEFSLATPLKYFVIPSGECKYNCSGCMQAGNAYPVTWDRNSAFRIAKQIDELGGFKTKIGSDFTVVPYFFDLAEYLSKNGIYVSASMIGENFTTKELEKMREIGIKMSVSMDGGEEISKKLRPGTFEHAIKALKLSKENEFPMEISFILSRLNANERELKEILSISREYDAGLKVRFNKPVGNSRDGRLAIPHEWFRDGRISDVKKIFDEAINDGVKIDHGITYKGDKRKPGIFDAYPNDCGLGFAMGIRTDFGTHGCGFLPDAYLQGENAKENTILSIWRYGKAMKKAREVTKRFANEKFDGQIDCPALLLYAENQNKS